MGWLRDRIPGWRRDRRPVEPSAEPPIPAPPTQKPAVPKREGPRLVLLVRDAAGPASYQLHTFEDEPEAAAFVQFWFPGDIEHGVIAFWASHEEPEIPSNDRPAEVVVLVRDETGPKTVYPFSFTDMDLAQAWVEREEDLGLNVDQLLIYWAVAARISRDHWDRVHLWPSEPPTVNRLGRLAMPIRPVFQSKPKPIRRGEDPATGRRAAPPEVRLPLPDELLASRDIGETAQDLPAAAEEPPASAAPAGPVFAPPTDAVAPAQAEQLPAMEEPPEVEAEEPEPLPETPIDPVTADEPAVFAAEEPPPPAVSEASAAKEPPRVLKRSAPPRKTKPKKGKLPFDPEEESHRLLRRSGWEKREGPFRGFGSPPGKF